MFCPQCKKQIPDDSSECSYCGFLINHKEQLPKEISNRRYQRWFFYALLVFIFLGMIGIIAKIYNANNKLLASLITAEETIENKQTTLDKTKESLEQKSEKLKKAEEKLSVKDQELKEKVDSLKEEMLNAKNEAEKENQTINQCQFDLSKANSNIYSLVINLGVGISTEDINKIPLADANLDGIDNDSDGLSNEIEKALGTNINDEDSDADGYTDKNELLKRFNPLGEGVFEKDDQLITKHIGDILIQVENNNEAWYIAEDGKKYFLGNPMNAFKTMRGIEYWTKTLPPDDSAEFLK